MDQLLSVRYGNLLGFLACLGLMGFALFAQYVLGMEPCPLCTFQRLAVIFMGVIFLLAGLHATKNVWRHLYTVLLAIGSLAGIGVAGRHVWLQNLPKDQVPACGPGLDFMVDTFPFFEVLDMVLSGSGECAEVSWRFIGLTMPAWTLICFIGLGVWALWINVLNLRTV